MYVIISRLYINNDSYHPYSPNWIVKIKLGNDSWSV